MYGESATGLMTFSNLSSDVEQFQDFCNSHKFITNCLDKQLIQTSSSSSSSSTAVLSDYDLGDLFKAPEPLITTTITSPQQLQLLTTDHIDLLNHVFYDLPTFSFPDSSCQIPKSISSDCLNSQLVNFNATDFGMRRAFSEGDIKTLSDPNNNNNNNYHPTEDRNQKLSRYRNKKTKRNFARKIKYACRKALADTQPRIRGRFAKTS